MEGKRPRGRPRMKWRESALEEDPGWDGNILSESEEIWKPGRSGRNGPPTGRHGKVSARPATLHRIINHYQRLYKHLLCQAGELEPWTWSFLRHWHSILSHHRRLLVMWHASRVMWPTSHVMWLLLDLSKSRWKKTCTLWNTTILLR